MGDAWNKHINRLKSLLYWGGFLAALFLVLDIARVFWWCIIYRTGGLTEWTIVWVGDILWIIFVELFLYVPLALYFLLVTMFRVVSKR